MVTFHVISPLDVFDNCFVTNCNHRFCLSCLQLILITIEQDCALCRSKVIEKECRVDEEIVSQINELNIKCNTCHEIFPCEKKPKHRCDGTVLLKAPIKDKKWTKGLITGDREVSLRILGFLKPHDIVQCARLNHEWNHLANNKYLWRHLFKKSRYAKLDDNHRDQSWKDLYISFQIGRLSKHMDDRMEGEVLVDLFDNYLQREVRSKAHKEYDMNVQKHVTNLQQEEIALQVALELSLKESKMIQNNLIDGEIEYEIVQEEQDDDIIDSQDEEEVLSTNTDATPLTDSSPIDFPPIQQDPKQLFGFTTNSRMYQ